MATFPALKPRGVSFVGVNLGESALDIVISGVGWVAVTAAAQHEVELLVHTPAGKGVFVRKPSLFPYDVRKRGKRLKKDDNTRFVGAL